VKSEFNETEAMRIYGDDEVSVAIWQAPHGKRENFTNLRDALLFVKADVTKAPVVKEIVVHHLGHDIFIGGENLDKLVNLL